MQYPVWRLCMSNSNGVFNGTFYDLFWNLKLADSSLHILENAWTQKVHHARYSACVEIFVMVVSSLGQHLDPRNVETIKTTYTRCPGEHS